MLLNHGYCAFIILYNLIENHGYRYLMVNPLYSLITLGASVEGVIV